MLCIYPIVATSVHLLSYLASFKFHISWDALSSIGTIGSSFFAWQALAQSNKRLAIESTPHVVSYSNLEFPNLTAIQIRNLGKGTAFDISVSSDRYKKKVIVDPTQPDNSYLMSKDTHTIMLKPNGLGTDKHGIVTAYVNYTDIYGTQYQTVAQFKQEKDNIKCLRNKVEKIS